MNIVKQDTTPTRAFSNYREICDTTRAVACNILELGRLFYDNHTNKYYEVLGYSSWREFLGDPDIGYAESTVRSFVHIYKLYVLKLAVAPKLLTGIGHSKLQIISPVVESDPDKWLYDARYLSKSDLIVEVRGLKSTGTVQPGGAPQACKAVGNARPSPLLRMTPEEYVALVKSSPCCICKRKGQTVAHHHPKKRARGVWWHVVPLCVECHNLYHAQESVYRHDWADFFFGWYRNLVVKEE